MHGKMRLIAGTNSKELGKKMSEELKMPLVDAALERFSDGEIRVSLIDEVRDADVYVLQQFTKSVNEDFMELLVLIDALKRTSVRTITAVLPYYCYGRQDRKEKSRVPITAKLIANLITTAGADRVLTVDLHASQIQGFFDITLDHLFGKFLIRDYIKENIPLKDLVIVSPDVGSAKRCRSLAKSLGLSMAVIEKERDYETENKSKTISLIGDVKNKNVVLLDDMIDTAGSMVGAVNTVRTNGAKKVYLACTHGIFSGEAVKRLNSLNLEAVITTDTVPLDGKKINNLIVLSVAPLLSDAICLLNQGESLSPLFEES